MIPCSSGGLCSTKTARKGSRKIALHHWVWKSFTKYVMGRRKTDDIKGEFENHGGWREMKIVYKVDLLKI